MGRRAPTKRNADRSADEHPDDKGGDIVEQSSAVDGFDRVERIGMI
jgi:hypothetical protein